MEHRALGGLAARPFQACSRSIAPSFTPAAFVMAQNSFGGDPIRRPLSVRSDGWTEKTDLL
jgi:hypothetical protein